MQLGILLTLIGGILFSLGVMMNLGLIAAAPFSGLKVGGFAAGSTIMGIGVLMVIIVSILISAGTLEMFQNSEENQ